MNRQTKLYMVFLASILLIGVSIAGAQPAPYVSIWSPWANVRSAPSLDAPAIARAYKGDQLPFVREVNGDPVSGNIRWYAVTYGSDTAYLHSSTVRVFPLGTVSLPTPAPTPTPTPLPTFVPMSTPVMPPVVMPTQRGVYVCSGSNDLDCDAFDTQTQANAHVAKCGFDEDDLDGSDPEDGFACEHLPF